MIRYKHILTDANVLYQAFQDARRGSSWKPAVQQYEANLMSNINGLQKELLTQTYRSDPVNLFIGCERGKTRPISSRTIRDRIVRHALCDNILVPQLRRKLIYDNGSSLKGKGVGFTKARFDAHLQKFYRLHGNDGYILFGDFSKYYDNIRHDLVLKDINEVIQCDYCAWLLKTIIDGFRIDVSYMSDDDYAHCLETKFDRLKYWESVSPKRWTGQKYMDKGIDIGDQVSQIIGVYYPHRIDDYVKIVCGEHFYARYMDDWYIISESKERLHELLAGIRKIAGEYGLFINDNKTHIVKLSGTFRFLQTRYSLTDTGRIIKKINPKTVVRMRRKLKKMAVKVENKELPYHAVEQAFKSWMGTYEPIMSQQTKESITNLYNELFIYPWIEGRMRS